jgi:hypothetical protein
MELRTLLRGSELVSTIAKLECLIFELLLLRCVPLISTTNAAGNLDISEIEPKFFSNLARRRSCKTLFLRKCHESTIFLHFINSSHFFTALRIVTKLVSIPPGHLSVM